MSSSKIGKALEEILNRLITSCKKNNFNIHFKNFGLNFVLQGTDDAYNEKKNDKTKVKVSNFCDELDNVWIYSQIIFEKIEATEYKKKEQKKEFDFYQNNSFKIDKSLFKISISISIFEGFANKEKTQLFRAEWDNHINEVHPQPHWQFYPIIIGEDKLKKDINDLTFPKEETTFLDEVRVKENESIYNFKKFHFSMNSGNWASELTHINYIKNDSDLINWYIGLLKHIRNQFAHCKKYKM